MQITAAKLPFNCKDTDENILPADVSNSSSFPDRNRTLLIFKYKMMASDDRFFSIYHWRKFHGLQYIQLWNAFLHESRPRSFRSIHNSFCHGMWKMFFQTCSNSEKILCFESPLNETTSTTVGCRLRQCSCLIKHNRICLCNCFQIFSTLHGNMMCICLT